MTLPNRRDLWAGIAVFAATAAYAGATWDAWYANFRVRAMCDEDRPYVMQRRRGVAELGIPAEMARRDPLLIPALEPYYPAVVTRRTRFELSQLGPTNITPRRAYTILQTEIAVRDRATNQAIASTSVFEVAERTQGWYAWRRHLVAPPAKCVPSDRAEFVRAVLRAE